MNPGAPLDPAEWTDIRHKGGSEPGVTAFAWWLERNDGERYVVVGLFNDADLAFSQFEANDLLTHAIDLI